MTRSLKGRGFRLLLIQQADIILMNTCTVMNGGGVGRILIWDSCGNGKTDSRSACSLWPDARRRGGDSIKRSVRLIDAVSPATKIEEFPGFD